MRLYWARVGPKSMSEREEGKREDTETQRRRKYEDGVRYWSHVSTSKGVPRIATNH